MLRVSAGRAGAGGRGVGGELHVDAADVLLEDGSRQEHLWGANDYPGRGPDNGIEFVSLIDIRPAQGNRGMEVADAEVRARIREVTTALIGAGETLPGPGTPGSRSTAGAGSIAASRSS